VVEQLIRNQQVWGSTPHAGSSFPKEEAKANLMNLLFDSLLNQIMAGQLRVHDMNLNLPQETA
jgi:hypothetical protein